LLEKYKNDIKIVFKNYPLPMHQFAGPAATAALAAHRQGKFWEFHHKLFESSSSLSNEKIQSIARDLKLNMEKFNRDLKDQEIQNLISRDMKEGGQAEVPGTPTIFVNGKLVQLRSLSDIDQAISAELKKKRAK
jgi:protein-disulfide isomerase